MLSYLFHTDMNEVLDSIFFPSRAILVRSLLDGYYDGVSNDWGESLVVDLPIPPISLDKSEQHNDMNTW